MVDIPIPPAASAEDYQGIDVSALSSSAAYHTMNAVVVPRPVAFVTTLGPGGVVNAAPYSYFNGVTADPPTISLAISRRGGTPKDTARNIRERGELVVNFSTVALARALSVAAGDFPPEQSEVELCGLALLPGRAVQTPRLANSPVHLECRLDQVLEVGRQPVDLVLARIVYIHARRDLLDHRGRISVPRLEPLARLAGNQFAGLHAYFEVPRGLPDA